MWEIRDTGRTPEAEKTDAGERNRPFRQTADSYQAPFSLFDVRGKTPATEQGNEQTC